MGYVSDLSPAEAKAAFNCVASAIYETFSKSPHVLVRDFPNWQQVNSEPFFSEDLGGRYVTIFANPRATGAEDANLFLDRSLPVGAVLAAPSFTVATDGVVTPGPLTLIEKRNRVLPRPLATGASLWSIWTAAPRPRHAAANPVRSSCARAAPRPMRIRSI